MTTNNSNLYVIYRSDTTAAITSSQKAVYKSPKYYQVYKSLGSAKAALNKITKEFQDYIDSRHSTWDQHKWQRLEITNGERGDKEYTGQMVDLLISDVQSYEDDIEIHYDIEYNNPYSGQNSCKGKQTVTVNTPHYLRRDSESYWSA